MRRIVSFSSALCAALLIVTALAVACRAPAPAEGVGLLGYMQQNGYLLHKLALSVGAGNQPLAAFYGHELEEVLEEMTTRVPAYEGHAIATLTRAMLMPAVASVQRHVDRGEWTQAVAGVEGIAAACNQCHVATAHGFVQVTSGADTQPFNQVFEPVP
jgi:hypothetical protein